MTWPTILLPSTWFNFPPRENKKDEAKDKALAKLKKHELLFHPLQWRLWPIKTYTHKGGQWYEHELVSVQWWILFIEYKRSKL